MRALLERQSAAPLLTLGLTSLELLLTPWRCSPLSTLPVAACRPWIVAMTASAFNEDRQRCQDCGMDDFLAKPFTEQDIRTMLRTYLQRAGPGNQAA